MTFTTKSDLEEGEDDIKYDRAIDLKIGQLVLIKNKYRHGIQLLST